MHVHDYVRMCKGYLYIIKNANIYTQGLNVKHTVMGQ